MEFSADKSEVIRITTKRNPIIYSYHIHQTTLSLKVNNQAKCLGVTITPELSWKGHIDNITKKASSSEHTFQPTRRQSKSLLDICPQSR